ncbi:MAG: Calx-beta domain-containing protein [Pyrinomonadaceae bacterium]
MPRLIHSRNEKNSLKRLIALTLVICGATSLLAISAYTAGNSPRAALTRLSLMQTTGEQTSVRQISLPTKDLVFDSHTQMIYASVPSSAGANGNSITPINPATGAVGTSVFIGSEPGKLAISDNGQYLYAVLEGAVAVRRFDIAAQTSGLQFVVRNSSSSYQYTPFDLAVLPGRPESIAVSGANVVSIYDNDVLRPTTVNSFFSPYLKFSASANTLYGVPNSSSSLQKISVNANGATLTSTTQIGSYGDFRFDNGRIYMPTGQVIDAGSGTLLGTFPNVGSGALVAPDSTAGRVYFLANGTTSGSLTLRAYDMNTFVLVGSTTITGVGGTATSLVRWGANGLAFRTGSSSYFGSPPGDQIYLVQTSLIPSTEPVPLATPTPSPAPSPTPSPTPASSIRQLALPSNDLVFDSSRQKIYASVPSVAGSGGNSITTIDPATAAIGASVFIGSEPNKLALTSDFRYLYTGLDGASSISRFDLTNQTAGLQFPLGGDNFNGSPSAYDLATLPGNPEALAVSKSSGAIAIYDNGVPRPTTTYYGGGGYNIESSASASTLFATSYNGTQKLSVTSSGVSVASTLAPNNYGDIRYDNGLLYTTSGKVLDAESGIIKGTFSGISGSGAFSPLVVPDSTHGRVFFLTPGGTANTAVLRTFDLNTFLQVGSLTIPNVIGNATSLVRWGTNGLAFRTNGASTNYYSNIPATADGQIFLIQTELVSPTEPITPAPTPSPTPTPSPSATVDIRQVALATNDIVYDPTRNTIYSSVPGSASGRGNTITPLNPDSGVLGTSVFIGSEPKKLSLSDNGQYLYAGLDGAGAVRRFDLATQTPGLQFSLGSDYNGALKAFDIAVLPGTPGSIAVSKSSSYSSYGIAIFDNDVQRPTASSSYYSYIEFAAANTLYSTTSSSELQKLSVTSQGVTLASTTRPGGSGDFRIANGRLYMPTGQVINVQTGMLVGKFSGLNYSSLVVPDPAHGRVYFLNGSDYYGSTPVTLTLKAFDINTFLPVGSVQIPGVAAAPTSLVRWGANGLAFRIGPNTSTTTPGNQIFLLTTSLIPSAEVTPPTFTFSSSTYSVDEATSSVTITVNRSGDNSAPATIDYAASNGTATAGRDYAATNGTFFFAEGESSKTFTVPIIDDIFNEGNETVNLTISNPAGATNAQSSAVLTILDNDPLPSLSINNTSVSEGNAFSIYPGLAVNLSAPSERTVTVDFATANGTATAGSDYVASSGTLRFAPGETSKLISVQVNGDTINEPDETFFVNLTNATNASIARAQGIGTIINDDPTPSITIDNANFVEGNSGTVGVLLPVRLSNPGSQSITVNYATADGTAVAGSDYVAASGTLAFAPGETFKFISVPINGDLFVENNETFFINLSNPVNATIAKGQGIYTILGDDSPPDLKISLSASPNPVRIDSNITYTLTVSNIGLSIAEAVTVTDTLSTAVSFVSCSSTNGGICGGSGTNRTVTFATLTPGAAASITLVAKVSNTLADGSGFANTATISSATADPNITNNSASATVAVSASASPSPTPTPQAIVQFSAPTYDVAENGGGAVITVVRTGSSVGAATVDYAIAEATAQQRSDYTLTSGTLAFADGETAKTFTVLIIDDAYAEPTETITLALSNPSGSATVLGTQPVATLRIIDNDASAPTTNPIDTTPLFVRQHYLDFLNRESDAGGLDYWSGLISQCRNDDQQCINTRRVLVSAAFFVEQEFQDTGSFVYRFYKASYGERPTYAQFMPDRSKVVGGADLEAGKQSFAEAWTQRPEFLKVYPQELPPATFIEQLINKVKAATGNTVDLSANSNAYLRTLQQSGRGALLRQIVDETAFKQAEYNNAFVLMQYFGYLRRDPETDGYNFWLDVLNNRVANNYRGMVCAFITSAEYQDRFSSVRTRNDSICGQLAP